MNKKLKKELKMAFSAPMPTKKDKFLREISYPKTSNLDFFISQIGYIRKRFWCLSALIVIAMVFFVKLFETQAKSIGILSSILPLLVLLSIAEIGRSTSYNMVEMEMSCKYNFGKITLIRLSLIGSFHFIILLFMLLIFANSSKYGFFRFSLYSITPFLLCAYLSLFITNHLQTKDVTYICGGVTSFISIGMLMLTTNFKIIYTQEFVLFGSIVFILIAVLLFMEVKNLMKQTEELKWNSQLTA